MKKIASRDFTFETGTAESAYMFFLIGRSADIFFLIGRSADIIFLFRDRIETSNFTCH